MPRVHSALRTKFFCLATIGAIMLFSILKWHMTVHNILDWSFWICQILLEDNGVSVTLKLMVCGFTTRSCMLLMIQRSFSEFFTTWRGHKFLVTLGGRNYQKGWGRKRNWLLVPFPACPTGTTKCFSFPIGYQFNLGKTSDVFAVKLVTIVYSCMRVTLIV